MKLILKYSLLLSALVFMQVYASNLNILDDTEDGNSYSNKKKPAKSILDLEDEKFLALYKKNKEDKNLPAKLLVLIQKHIDAQDYIFAQYYVKLYLRNYSEYGELDKVWYFGIQTLFIKFKTTESQEGLIREILRLVNDFEHTFPQSVYMKEVEKIRDKSIVIECKRNNDIASYYDKRGKRKAAAFYRAKYSEYCNNAFVISKLKEKQSNLDLLNDDSFE